MTPHKQTFAHFVSEQNQEPAMQEALQRHREKITQDHAMKVLDQEQHQYQVLSNALYDEEKLKIEIEKKKQTERLL